MNNQLDEINNTMLTKELIISGINKLPESFTIDDVLDQIVLISKIEKGIEQVENGQIIPDEEIDERLTKWFD